MIERDQKMMKFVCRFCNKRYPCGKSLGGHLRSHKIATTVPDEDCNRAKTSKRELGIDLGDNSNYGLRTNPKKTRRFGDSTHIALQEQQQQQQHQDYSNVCKECGKGFQSLKALCGHMACHSEKDKAISDNWSDDDVSDSETSISEIEQEEQEELAKCLMMLSRDKRSIGQAPNSGPNFSESNSVVLESKSSPIRVRVRAMEMKQKSAEVSRNDRSGSGFFRYEHGKHESDGSVDGLTKSKEVEKPRFKNINICLAKNELNKHECSVCERLFDSRKALAGHISASLCGKKINSREGPEYWKRDNRGSPSSCGAESKKKLGAKKSYKHECPICFRVFRSGQALGGHKRSHFLGGNSDEKSTVIIGQDINEVPALIDLNLPAPLEDEANGDCSFVLY